MDTPAFIADLISMLSLSVFLCGIVLLALIHIELGEVV